MDEREAVARLRAGDVGGLEALVRRYQVHAVRTAYLVTRDRSLAEDVVQAAFVKAYERIGQFDPERTFGPWFLRSVLHDAIKVARSRDRHRSLDAMFQDGQAAGLTDVLARYASEKSCLDARQDGEAIIAGRPAYQIVTTPKPEGCGELSKDGADDPKAGAEERKRAMLGEMRIWVDKETFLLLKSESRDRSGTVLERGEVTSIEYNVNIPDSIFTYTPPAGVLVREFTGASPDDVKRALVEDDAKGGDPPPKKP